MSRGVFLRIAAVLAVAALAVSVYCGYFRWATAATAAFDPDKVTHAGLAWLKAEYALSEETAATIEQMTAAFAPRCEAMCEELAAARGELTVLVGAPDVEAPAIEAAYAKVNAIEQECFRMSLRHIYEVGALMRPEQGARYRKHMVTRLMGYRSDHHRLHTNAPEKGRSQHP